MALPDASLDAVAAWLLPICNVRKLQLKGPHAYLTLTMPEQEKGLPTNDSQLLCLHASDSEEGPAIASVNHVGPTCPIHAIVKL